MTPEIIRRIRPLHNQIAFEFVEEVGRDQLKNKTAWGFEYQVSTANTIQPPRWGRVLAVGPDARRHYEFPVGSYILIEPLMWTEGQRVDGMKFWYTSDQKVMLVSDTEPT